MRPVVVRVDVEVGVGVVLESVGVTRRAHGVEVWRRGGKMMMCVGVRRGPAFVRVGTKGRMRRRGREAGQRLYLGGRVGAHFREQARRGNGRGRKGGGRWGTG